MPIFYVHCLSDLKIETDIKIRIVHLQERERKIGVDYVTS